LKELRMWHAEAIRKPDLRLFVCKSSAPERNCVLTNGFLLVASNQFGKVFTNGFLMVPVAAGEKRVGLGFSVGNGAEVAAENVEAVFSAFGGGNVEPVGGWEPINFPSAEKRDFVLHLNSPVLPHVTWGLPYVYFALGDDPVTKVPMGLLVRTKNGGHVGVIFIAVFYRSTNAAPYVALATPASNIGPGALRLPIPP
jgi:hypothetical protein